MARLRCRGSEISQVVGVKFTQTYLCVPASNFHSPAVLCHGVTNGQGVGRGADSSACSLHSPLLHRSEEQWAEQVFPLIEPPGRPAAREGVLAHLLADELEARTLALRVPQCYQICASLRALQENCRALQLFQAGDNSTAHKLVFLSHLSFS